MVRGGDGLQMAPELMLDLARKAAELVVERIENLPGEDAWDGDFQQILEQELLEDPPEGGRPAAEVLERAARDILRFAARIIHQRRKKRLTEPGFTTKDAVTGCWEVCSAEIGRWEVKNGVFGTQHSRRQLRNRVFGPSWAAKWGEVCPRRARRSLAQGMRS